MLSRRDLICHLYMDSTQIYEDSIIIRSGDVEMTYECPIGLTSSGVQFACRVTYMSRDFDRVIEIMGALREWRIEWPCGSVVTFWGFLNQFSPCSDIRRGQKICGANIYLCVCHT
jgi:hypothetical protein